MPESKCIFTEQELDFLMEKFGLGQREDDVVRCIGCGLTTDKEIVAKLGIARPTLRTHLSRMGEKIGETDKFSMLMILVSKVRGRGLAFPLFTPEELDCIGREFGLSQGQMKVLKYINPSIALDKQIARKLGISRLTCRTHWNRMQKKIRTHGRLDMLVTLVRAVRKANGEI